MNSLHRDLKICVENALELNREKIASDEWRSKYHIMPPIGWLNDPNGVCYFKGYYHVFYQYSPFDATGGLKLWGHFRSKDLVNWEDMNVAMYADQKYDIHGVYSGSTIVHDGKMHIFYTGNVKNIGDYDYITSGREHNTVHAVSEDGKNFEKVGVVISHEDYPKGFTNHIRDPKVWKQGDKFYMVLGARDKNNEGQVIMYSSDDLYAWEYCGVVAGPVKGMGYMWECPDLFNLDGMDVLAISPQGIEAKGYEYQNVYQTGYYVGKLDYDTNQYTHGTFTEMDRGFDFYATQTFEDDKGRRIAWSWLGLPDIEDEYYSNPTVSKGWQHMMTIPRELQLKGDKLLQLPVEELKGLRKEYYTNEVKIEGVTELEGLQGETYELFVEVISGDEITLILRDDAKIIYNKAYSMVELRFGKSGYGRKSRKVEIEELRDIRVFSDMSSLEIFINGGEETFTTRIYPKVGSDTIKFNGNAHIKIDKWEI